MDGLQINMKIRFQVIMPKAKKSTAKPETLFRSFGNCDHRQFNIGMELMAKHVMGISNQNTANVTMLNLSLITNGANA